MPYNVYRLPQLCWSGVCDLELPLPSEWDVQVCHMAGHDRPALTPSQIRDGVCNPLGTPPIRTLVRGKKQIVIIFDDIQRGTRVSDIVPAVLEELAAAGIRDEQVQFIAATGCHAAMDRFAFAKKLGEQVLHRFPVYSHNAFGNCVEVGTTTRGTRLLANAEVMACDFKIAIGSVVPHAFAGFGGGAKIILPGICHYQTCLDFHRSGSRYASQNRDKAVGIGVLEDNPLRLDMEEAAAIVGLDIKIDTLMNSYGETVAVYAGTLDSAYPAAVADARRNYDTAIASEKDIVIANSFAKAAECESGLEMAFPSVRPEGGDVVLIANAPEGHVEHYLAGPWGQTTRGSFQMQCGLSPAVRQLIIFSEYPDLTIYNYFAQREKVRVMSKWDEVIALLKKSHPGSARVAIYPNADIQYCSTSSGSKVLSFFSR